MPQLRSLLLMVLLALLLGSAVADAPRLAEITQQPGWRLIHDPVDPIDLAHEATRPTILDADRPISLHEPQPQFERLDDHSFVTRFPWNDAVERSAVFQDDVGDLTPVTVRPASRRPFDAADHDVPVIHVLTDSTHLWHPDTGVYVWGLHDNCLQTGEAWERPAHFRFYEPGAGLVVDEPVGLRIHGGYGRYYHQKGLRFYFDGYGSSETIDYPFFAEGPESFRRLIARANRYDSFAVNTHLLETLFADLGHLASRYRWTALYLNDEYWGAYALRERPDTEFIETTWDLEHTGYNLIKDGETTAGDGSGWWSFLASFGTVTDPGDPTWFDSVRATMDLASYIDWQLINIFCVSGDNGFAWNLVLFQPGSYPWRFVMWDEDLSFDSGDEGTNMFRFYTARNEAEWNEHRAPGDFRTWDESQQEWLTMFRTLLGNADFRRLLRSRFEHLMGGQLSVAALHQRLDQLAESQWPEVPNHADRWEGFRVDWYEYNLNRTRQWIADRHPVVMAQADEFFTEWPAPEWPTDLSGLRINEILAANDAVNQDEAGGFNDWVEIANVGDEPRDLTGCFLTDDLAQPTRWECPAVMLRPGDHVVVWCDGDPAQGPLHTSFKLSAGGEEVGLFAPVAAGNGLLDSHVFGPQIADVSVGRSIDDPDVWVAFDEPTPGEPNGNAIATPDSLPVAAVMHGAYPNPFNAGTTVSFAVPAAGRVRLDVMDVRGRQVVKLLDQELTAGQHTCPWDGRDNQARAMPSGVYLLRLITAHGNDGGRLTLVR